MNAFCFVCARVCVCVCPCACEGQALGNKTKISVIHSEQWQNYGNLLCVRSIPSNRFWVNNINVFIWFNTWTNTYNRWPYSNHGTECVHCLRVSEWVTYIKKALCLCSRSFGGLVIFASVARRCAAHQCPGAQPKMRWQNSRNRNMEFVTTRCVVANISFAVRSDQKWNFAKLLLVWRRDHSGSSRSGDLISTEVASNEIGSSR